MRLEGFGSIAKSQLPHGESNLRPSGLQHSTITDKQQEKASRRTHAKDTAKLTRKTEQQKSTNGNVQRVTTCK
jgi:hypothetical protein